MPDYVSHLSKKQEFLLRCRTKYLFSHNFQNPCNPCQGILMPRLGLLTTKHQAVRAGYAGIAGSTGAVIAWALFVSAIMYCISLFYCMCHTRCPCGRSWDTLLPYMVDTTQDKKNRTVKGLHLLQCVIYGKIRSGRQDSNLRHPAPKAGALPG